VVRSIIIQVIVFAVIFNIISWFKESSMLTTDTQVTVTKSLPTLMDSTVELHAEGGKTILYFFAPWCQVCHFSIDNLQDFYLNNQDVNVVAIALDYNDIEEVTAFAKQHQLTFPIALGNESIKKHYSIGGYPSYYVMDEKNMVIGKSLGYSTELGIYLRTL